MNNSKFFLTLIALISFHFSKAQVDSFFKYTDKSVVYLFGDYIDSSKIKHASGTGFFITHDDYMYLVTASHVAKKLQIKPKFLYCNINNKPIELDLSATQESAKTEWYFDPNSDVAILGIYPESEITRRFGYQSINSNVLISQLTPLSRYTETISFGFPLNLGIRDYISPITTSSKIASGLLSMKRFDTNQLANFILLDAPSIPGLSGGPVFSIPTFINLFDSSWLIGLVHGVISDKTGGKFAAIVPSHYILEAIKKTKRFNGVGKVYYSNGKLWTERLYKNGYLVEVLSNYSITGIPQDKGTLKNGNGDVKYYDEKGKLIAIDSYKNNKRLKREYM